MVCGDAGRNDCGIVVTLVVIVVTIVAVMFLVGVVMMLSVMVIGIELKFESCLGLSHIITRRVSQA